LELDENEKMVNEHALVIRYSNLACLMSEWGRFVDAELYSRRAVVIGERVLGNEHQDTLASMTTLGVLLARKGDTAGGEQVLRRVLQTHERVTGPEHPSTLICVTNLAHVLSKKGAFAAALPLAGRAAATSTKVFGETNPLVLHRWNNVALILIALSKLDDARKILSRNTQPGTLQLENLTPRILLLQWVVELLAATNSGVNDETSEPIPVDVAPNAAIRSPQPAFFLGQLKTHFANEPLPTNGSFTVNWDVEYFVDSLQPRLGPENTGLLRALVAVLNARTSPTASVGAESPLTALDAFPAWREATPQELE
jgi:hypothetical protein